MSRGTPALRVGGSSLTKRRISLFYQYFGFGVLIAYIGTPTGMGDHFVVTGTTTFFYVIGTKNNIKLENNKNIYTYVKIKG